MRVPEIVLGFLLGIALFAWFELYFSYGPQSKQYRAQGQNTENPANPTVPRLGTEMDAQPHQGQGGNENQSFPNSLLEFNVTDALLVLFTGLLWFSTSRLYRATAGLKASTDKLAEAGERQIAISGLQADILEKQKEISRLQFFAANRPHIIVHTFEKSIEQDLVGAHFTCVNAGTSDAKITEIAAAIFEDADLRPGMDIPVIDAEGWTLQSGEKSSYTVKSGITKQGAVVQGMREQRGQATDDLICIGRISYTDARGAKRETGFHRAYNFVTGAWQRVENSEYEYSY